MTAAETPPAVPLSPHRPKSGSTRSSPRARGDDRGWLRQELPKADAAASMVEPRAAEAVAEGRLAGRARDRANWRMLALAWLVRVDDAPQHRQWLLQVARELVEHQQPCGAVPDRCRQSSAAAVARV